MLWRQGDFLYPAGGRANTLANEPVAPQPYSPCRPGRHKATVRFAMPGWLAVAAPGRHGPHGRIRSAIHSVARGIEIGNDVGDDAAATPQSCCFPHTLHLAGALRGGHHAMSAGTMGAIQGSWTRIGEGRETKQG